MVAARQTCWLKFRALLPDELHGQYSIARLKAFHEYCERSSGWWILFVIVATPLPSAVLVILLNFLPLEDPASGWRANGVAFARLAVSVTVGVGGTMIQRMFYAPEIKSNAGARVVINIVSSGVYMAIYVAVCANVAFPMPFSILIPIVINVPLTLFIVALIDLRKARRAVAVTDQASVGRADVAARALRRYKRIVVVNFSLLFVYPLYTGAHRRLSGAPKALYTLLLPVMKLVFVEIAKKRLVDVQDLAAESTVFTVELFNALFVSICMSSANSRVTSAVIMTVDLLQMGYHLRELSHRARHLTRERDRAGFGQDNIVAACVASGS